MIVKEIFYGVECNRCRETFEDGEHSFWMDENTAIEQATESEWIEEKGKHYCPNCHTIDEETDEVKILPEYPEHLKLLKRYVKSLYAYEKSVHETKENFKMILSLNKNSKLELIEENYIKSLLSDKFILLEYPEKQQYRSQECHVTMSK